MMGNDPGDSSTIQASAVTRDAMKTPAHDRASESHAAERYLLGELSAAEAEEFELHYFECAECAEDVESGEQFIANARAVFADRAMASEPARAARQASKSSRPLSQDKQGKSRRSFREALAAWMQPSFAMPAMAAALLGAVALYQGAVLIPELRKAADAAQSPVPVVLEAEVRGEPAPTTIPAGARFLALSLDLPPEPRFASYVCDLSDPGGGRILSVPCSATSDGKPMLIGVDIVSKGLKPGRKYTLSVTGQETQGQPSGRVATASFVFQYR